MQVFKTEAIMLRRTNYGEADRIISFITPDRGKLSAIAKGVRKPKSKLAGGLELFAASDITIAEGRGGPRPNYQCPNATVLWRYITRPTASL